MNHCGPHRLHLYSLQNELTHRKSKTEGLENVSNLCNFQLFASNIYGNNIDQRQKRNCGEAKTFMGPTFILCKISNFFSTLDWERPSLRRKKQKVLMMYKTMNDLAPEYLSLFSQRHSACNLKNSEGRLTLSKPSTNYLKRSFSYSGAML